LRRKVAVKWIFRDIFPNLLSSTKRRGMTPKSSVPIRYALSTHQ
jgi:hypothetical protein